jgi:hypothetical protein
MPYTNFTMLLITSGLTAELVVKFLAKKYADKFPLDGKEVKYFSVQRLTFSGRALRFGKLAGCDHLSIG